MRNLETDPVELVQDAFRCLGEYVVGRVPFSDAYEAAYVAATEVPVPEEEGGFDHATPIRSILGGVIIMDNGPARADGKFNLMAVAERDARTQYERDAEDYRRVGVCLIASETYNVGALILDPIGEGLEPFITE